MLPDLLQSALGKDRMASMGALSLTLWRRFQEGSNRGLVGTLIEWRDSIAWSDCHRPELLR